MEKSARILNLIGYVLEILLGVLMLFLLVVGIIILTPTGEEIIRQGLIDGSIHGDPSKTIEENIALIKFLFVIFDVIMGVISLLFIAASILAILCASKKKNRSLVIASLILSILAFNPILIAANILFIIIESESTTNLEVR